MSTSNNKDKNSGLVNFLSNVLSANLKTLFLANLLLDIPLVIAAGIIALVSYFLGGVYTYIVAIVIPLLAPFTAGVFYIVRNIARGDEIKVFRDFKKGIRENAFQFAVQGIVNYFVFVGFYITFEFYRNDLSNPIIIAALVTSIIVALIYAFMTFNMGMMTVTVKLRSIDIYKNALLLSFIAIIQNVKTLIALLFTGAVIFSLVIIIGDMTAILCTLAVLVLLILPTFVILIIGYNSYPAVKNFVIDSKTDEDKLLHREQPKEKVLPQLSEEELMEYAEGDPNEYVYVDGKMVKRSTVKKMLEKLQKE